MAETLSPHYSWVKPDIGGDASTWGNVLNQTIDAVDSVVYANQQAGVPIGSVTMFAGSTPPANWLLCQGQSLATAGTYAALFAAIGYAFGGSGANFNLPDLQGIFPLGAGSANALGSKAGSYTYTISVANLPSHTHPIADQIHGHGVNQWSHSHTISTGGHSHSISTGSHSHGSVLNDSGVTGASPPAGIGKVGNAGRTDTAGDLGGSASFVGNLGGGTDVQGSAISIQANYSNINTTQAAGSGVPMNIIPSYVALGFIIRFQ